MQVETRREREGETEEDAWGEGKYKLMGEIERKKHEGVFTKIERR